MEEHDPLKDLVDDATFDFTMGDESLAIEKLEKASEEHPKFFGIWHALAEMHYSLKDFDAALAAAEAAYAINSDDLFINTTLSRVWLEKGSKEKAELFGAQAKMQGWKEQLINPDEANSGINL